MWRPVFLSYRIPYDLSFTQELFGVRYFGGTVGTNECNPGITLFNRRYKNFCFGFYSITDTRSLVLKFSIGLTVLVFVYFVSPMVGSSLTQ